MDAKLILAGVRRCWVLACILAIFAMPGESTALDHEFAGSKKCSFCHQSAKKGEQYKKWKESKHAGAFDVLATPAAKESGAKMGVTDPQTNGKCLKCHSTAYGFTTERVSEAIPVEEGVSCESCHGAGKDYLKKSVMEDKAAAIAAGLVIPDEKVCVKCHNPESPNYKPFNFAESWDAIKHSMPK